MPITKTAQEKIAVSIPGILMGGAKTLGRALLTSGKWLGSKATGGLGVRGFGYNTLTGARDTLHPASQTIRRAYRTLRRGMSAIPPNLTQNQRTALKTVSRYGALAGGAYLGNKAYQANMQDAQQREQEYRRLAREQALDRQMNHQYSIHGVNY